MDDLDNRTSGKPDDGELQAQFDRLRHLVTSILILVVVISGTFNICLLRLWRTTSRELAGLRAQATPLMAEYQKSGPLMQDFIKKLTEYGRTHPDFSPILAKYNLKPAGETSTPPIRAVPPASVKPKK